MSVGEWHQVKLEVRGKSRDGDKYREVVTMCDEE